MEEYHTMMQTILKYETKEIAALLPSVVIEYLWKLSLSGSPAQAQFFTLTPHRLGGQSLQHIEHIAVLPYHKANYRVFGFTPCNARITIQREENGLVMSLMSSASEALSA
jgi:hypothetical protein